MNKAISLAILAGGIVLLIFGINEYNSAGSEISQFFTGSTTNKPHISSVYNQIR
jgi:hypothetical protein